jgi:crotonobetainyl-CoA:carnitine CoA-transferase CaiB-like acyl-CoA transferase
LLGQHTREVLEGVLGLDAARIGELERERVIGA